jgi:predicted MFS family arabinose efflux permease
MSLLDDALRDHARTERRLVAALLLAGVTVSFNATLGVSLIPAVGRMYGLSGSAAHWVLTITLLVSAVAIPGLGRLGDGALRRRVLLGTLACAFAGSVIAATAASFAHLLVGRALQGVGYATIPLAVALAREHTTGERTRRSIAALSVTVAVGAGIGYPVTGAVVETLGFDAAFWFAAIVSGVAYVAVAATVPRRTGTYAPLGLDLVGALLLTGGLVTLLLAISNASHWGWSSRPVLGLGSIAAVVLAAWVLVELRHSHPLIDLRLVSQRDIVGANMAGLFVSVGMFMALALVSSFAQTPASAGYGFGASLTVAGLVLLPIGIASVLSRPLADHIVAWIGARGLLAAGSALLGGTLLGLALSHGHIAVFAAASTLFGIGIGCTFSAMPGIIVANVPAARTGSAMSLNQVIRGVGGAAGSAIAATILGLHQAAGASFPSERGYSLAFLAAAIACLLTVPFVLLLRSGAGRAAVPDDDELLSVDPTTGVRVAALGAGRPAR